MNSTIVALATPPLKSALAIIRVSGDEAFSYTSEIFSRPLEDIKKRTSLVGYIKDDNETIDQVVLIAYPHPNSMTGEDVVEIICHGSMLIANEIINCYLKRGAAMATRGEFTMRAFLHNKINLLEAEAINDLINATTKESQKLSLMAMHGDTTSLIEPLKTKVADLLSLIEVNIDYPEYQDIEQANDETVLKTVKIIREEVKKLISQGKEGKTIKEGVKIALIGEPNVGKSSLLNSLIHEDKAIVSDIPGTTRDVVEGETNYRGLTLRFFDTAGIREKADKLEQIGIEKAEKIIKDADVIILVIDAKKGRTDEDPKILEAIKDKKVIEVYNKSDLISEQDNDKFYVSAISKNITPLLDKIYEAVGVSDEAFSIPSLNNVRQISTLQRIDKALSEAEKDARMGIPVDLISSNLMVAYNGFRELLGEEITNNLTDEIFSRFCVGK